MTTKKSKVDEENELWREMTKRIPKKYNEISHAELIDQCVERGLIARPVVIRKGRGWRIFDKLWRKWELVEMLEGGLQ
jgi:hypothetical protein